MLDTLTEATRALQLAKKLECLSYDRQLDHFNALIQEGIANAKTIQRGYALDLYGVSATGENALELVNNWCTTVFEQCS